jgi:hypothetical protein
MRIYIEYHEKKRAQREETEKRVFELAVADWISQLGEQEKFNIVTSQQEHDPWHQCVKYLQKMHPKKDIDTWICPLQPLNENGCFVLLASNEFVKDEVKKRYSDVFQKFLVNYIVEVGHSGQENGGDNKSYSQEIMELRKYFKNYLWAEKRKKILIQSH